MIVSPAEGALGSNAVFEIVESGRFFVRGRLVGADGVPQPPQQLKHGVSSASAVSFMPSLLDVSVVAFLLAIVIAIALTFFNGAD